jgi:hypothetical protein
MRMGKKTMRGAARMRANRAVAVSGLLWACAGGACASTPRVGAQSIPDRPPAGWSIPDDSVEVLFHRSNLVIVHERTSGPYPANLVLVAFRPGTTPAQRAQAVAAVQGSLVGGNRAYYILRVEARCAHRPVWCAIDILEPLPQVEEAHPYLYGGSAPATDFERVETIVTPKP